MADETAPENTPTEPEVPATDGDMWDKLKGVVREVVKGELGEWESKRSSGKSSKDSTPPGTPEQKKPSFLEKLISG